MRNTDLQIGSEINNLNILPPPPPPLTQFHYLPHASRPSQQTIHRPIAGSMFARRLRLRPNIDPALGQAGNLLWSMYSVAVQFSTNLETHTCKCDSRGAARGAAGFQFARGCGVGTCGLVVVPFHVGWTGHLSQGLAGTVHVLLACCTALVFAVHFLGTASHADVPRGDRWK